MGSFVVVVTGADDWPVPVTLVVVESGLRQDIEKEEEAEDEEEEVGGGGDMSRVIVVMVDCSQSDAADNIWNAKAREIYFSLSFTDMFSL